ncbi:MAG: hypothetical protein ACRC14_13385, partial [Paracoccaceae bacterium]
MSTIFSMLDIMNAALISEGFDEIVVEADGSDEWRLLSRNWPQIVESELERGLYNFSRKQANLQSRQPGAFGYDDAYLVPSDALHVRQVWTEDDGGDRQLIQWHQDGLRVYVNEPAGVWIEYLEAADPSFWGAIFSRGVQLKLQAVLLQVKEEHAQARMMEERAENVFQEARTVSSK